MQRAFTCKTTVVCSRCQASNNVNLTGSVLSNIGANSQTQIVAGNDINMNTVTTTYSEKGDWGRGNDRSLTRSTDIGSQIISNSDVTLLAGHDVNTRAATVSAQGGISVAAGHNINLDSGNASYHLTENSHQSSGGCSPVPLKLRMMKLRYRMLLAVR